MTRVNKYIFFAFFFFGSLVLTNQAQAEDFIRVRQLDLVSRTEQIISSPEKEVALKVSLKEGINTKPSVKLMTLAPKGIIGNFFTYPANISPASDLYFVKMPFNGLDRAVSLKYTKGSSFKEAYFYNWNNLSFEKIRSSRDEASQTMTFTLPDNEEYIFALFDESEISGLASWYTHAKYAGQMTAASRDLALNSKVRVKNEDGSKEAVVTVKDYGPKKCADWTAEENLKMGPCQERIMDLSKEAFSVLSPLSAGVIKIKIMPL
ncbi:MAG: septal ring lytic transglycosylase RlpA family protein [Patescibacteria group bacterium]